MTTKDFITVIDKITEIKDTNTRLTVLKFFLMNGSSFNKNFNENVFHGRYIAEMEKKGK